MERSEAWTAIDDQRRALVHLLEDLSEQEWRQPSLCERLDGPAGGGAPGTAEHDLAGDAPRNARPHPATAA